MVLDSGHSRRWTMNGFSTLDRLHSVKELWFAAMPKECPPPEDFEFLLWLDVFPTELIEFAIMRTSKKMRLNLRDGIRLIPNAAQRYCTSVLTNRMKDRAKPAPIPVTSHAEEITDHIASQCIGCGTPVITGQHEGTKYAGECLGCGSKAER